MLPIIVLSFIAMTPALSSKKSNDQRDYYDIWRSPSPGRSHNFISQFLEAIYNWRSDLRSEFEIETEHGALQFVLWWLKSGFQNYGGDVDIDVGLTLQAEELLFSFQELPENNRLKKAPTLFFKSLNFYPDLKNEFVSGDNILSKEFATWICKDGIKYFNLSALTPKSRAYQKINAADFLQSSVSWFDYSILKGKEFLDDQIALLSSQEIQKLIQDFTTADRWPRPPKNLMAQLDPAKTPNFSIIGVPSLGIGIAEDSRRMPEALDKIGWSYQIIDRYHFHEASQSKINLFCLPAPDILMTMTVLPQQLTANSFNIACCHWELPLWPPSLYFLLEFFDEIWVYAKFVQDSIPKSFAHKVKLVPNAVQVDPFTSYDRGRFALDQNDFLFFTAFDFSSSIRRKNPDSTLRAFEIAFKGEKNVKLVIKTNNSHLRSHDASKFRKLISSDQTIIIDEFLSKSELHSLYKSCDVFVSLHRSEGFGLNIAEAMLLEKPVIVTGFSGNLEFCKPDTAFLVPFERVMLKPEEYIFSEEQWWADPNVEDAASAMRFVFENRDAAGKKALLGRKYIEKNHSIDTLSKFLKSRFEEQFS